jgi:hypothetical protein
VHTTQYSVKLKTEVYPSLNPCKITAADSYFSTHLRHFFFENTIKVLAQFLLKGENKTSDGPGF